MTSTYLKAFLLVILLTAFNACEDEEIDSACGSKALISKEFDTKPSDQFTISSVQLDGQCLAIEIGAGGCDGESWKAELLISATTTLSDPGQRSMRLILDDKEMCEAFIQKTFYFDLSVLESQRYELWLEGWHNFISYPGIDTSDVLGSWNLTNVNGGLTGINDDFEKGQIVWTFKSSGKVEIDNKNTDENKSGGLKSGIYPYQVIVGENQIFRRLEVNEMNFGNITSLTKKRFVVDLRPVDGLQYTFEK